MPDSPLSKLVIDRRGTLAAGLAGFGLLVSPAWAEVVRARGFTHGVASGEPAADSVLLWTRFVGVSETKLRYELSENADFKQVAASGEAMASPDRDWCAKAAATGLAPGRWYHYRFIAPDGTMSPVGRTRTLPQGKLDAFRMAVFSCSNFGFGWFNAYAHAAEDGAFDLAVHLGDYYYEYRQGEYPTARQALPERLPQLPFGESIALADYRLRHAVYRADPDLQRLHQSLPWVLLRDDHETANDSWKGGAENHDPLTEGPWSARKAASERAYREWMPVSDEPWQAYEIGDLATLFRIENRLTARDRQFDLAPLATGSAAEIEAALRRFRADRWRDPRRTMLGPTQEAWLARGFRESRRSGKVWQVLAQQQVMGEQRLPAGLADGMSPDTPDFVRRRVAAGALQSRAGLPWNMDAWDGYPAARERLLGSARAADANLVVLTGDSHNAWAYELPSGGEAAGVEFAGHSVTSPGFEGNLPWIDPSRLAAETVKHNSTLKWADTSRRGYMAVELTPAQSTCEWRFLQTVRQRTTALAGNRRMATMAGTNRFT